MNSKKKSSVWKEFTLTLIVFLLVISIIYYIFLNLVSKTQTANSPSSSSSVNNSLIKVGLGNFSRYINSNFLCFNNNSLLVSDWNDTRFQDSVRSLNPSFITTGGVEANYFNWQKGGLYNESQNGVSIPFPAEIKFQNQATNTNLASFYSNTKTKPVWVLNMLTDNLDSQIFRLQDAQSKGMNVEYIQLGSGLYSGTVDSVDGNKIRFPGPIDYALEARKWTEKLNSAFPEAKIAYLAQTGSSESVQAKTTWNDIVGVQMSNNPALSLNLYGGNGLTKSDKLEDNVNKVLSQPTRLWVLASNDIKILNQSQRIWISESNVFETSDNLKILGTWLSGLYNISLEFQMMQESRVDIACNHVLFGNSQWAAIYGENSSLKNTWKTDFTPHTLSATGHTLSFLSKALVNSKIASILNFSNSLVQTDSDNISFSGLSGWSFSDGNSQKLLILNQTNSSAKLDLKTIFPDGGKILQISSQPQTLIKDADSIQTNSINFAEQISTPAYSLTLISPK